MLQARFGNFENHLLSGKLIIVTDGACNVECQKVLDKISKVTAEYYITDTQKDINAQNYMKEIKYDGPYPIYFFKSIFLSSIDNDEELASILKDL
jgi:hypothetical protein